MGQQLLIDERFTAIVRDTSVAIAAPAGAVSVSIYSPAVGVRALVQWLWVNARFSAAPGASDIGIGSLRIIRSGATRRLGSVRIVQVDGQRERNIGFPCHLILDENDELFITSNAISSSVSVNSDGAVHALEYAPL